MSSERKRVDWPLPNWGNKWSESEVDSLKALAPDHTVYEISRQLGRSTDGVWQKLRKLGIKSRADRWQNRSRKNGR